MVAWQANPDFPETLTRPNLRHGTLGRTVARYVLPPVEPPTIDWLTANLEELPDNLETKRFDLAQFPHARAVFAANDDEEVQRIIAIWGTRLGKTITMILCQMKKVHCTGRPGLFASSNEARAKDTVENLIYPLLRKCTATKFLLRPEHRQGTEQIDIGNSRIRVGWSGSPDTMAGFPSCYSIANETSKWSTNKSDEASPLRLFTKRSMLYPFDRKEYFEGTPSELGKCQITKLAHEKTVRRHHYHVPCMRCGFWQVLDIGSKDPASPGLKWEHGPEAHSDPDLAKQSAYYRCGNCGGRNEDVDRPAMMRAGIWVPEGQTLDKRDKLTGQPLVGRQQVAFIDLGSIYSLMINGWGQIAYDWVNACRTDDARRDFDNSTRGIAHDPKPRVIEPHQLAERLGGPHQAGTVPEWGKLLTVGVDVQMHGQVFVYVVMAWGDGGRGAEIAHGICEDFETLCQQVLYWRWPHADGGPPMSINLGIIDASDQAQQIYGLCRKVRYLLPSKGLSNPIAVEYVDKSLDPKKQRAKFAMHTVRLIEINVSWTNDWLERYIGGRVTEAEPKLEISCDSCVDFDFLEQLLNEKKIRSVNKRGYDTVAWMRIDENFPNDYRDALRMAKVGASILTDRGKRWNQLPPRKRPANPPPRATRQTVTMPDGRPFLITER